MFKTIKKLVFDALILLVFLIFALVKPHNAQAAGITAISDTMSRIQTSQNSSHTIKFTTQNAIQTTGDTVAITFPADFNFTGKTTATMTFTHGGTTGLENTETINNGAPNATNWGGAFSGVQNRTFTLTAPTDGVGAAAVAASDKLIITYSSANSVNATTANTNYIITVAVAGSTSESGSTSVYLINPDQTNVTANVDPSITFSMDHTSTDFGTITSTAVKTSVPNIIFQTSTNATNGYTISIADEGNGANPGLYNSVSTYLLGSANAAYDNTADLGAVAGYGIQASSATATIDARYNQAGTNVGGFERSQQTLATFNSVADSHNVTLVAKAKVLGSSPAGNYADTMTVIATGNF